MTTLAGLLGESAVIVQLRDQVSRLLGRHAEVGARRRAPILILGETGTGKGLLARAIHDAGPRAAGPFVDVNCAAIPANLLEAELFGFERGAFTDARQAKAGLFQTAHGGTLFLDEVGLFPEALQAKLLTALEERTVRRLGSTRRERVDVSLVAATSEDLDAAIRERRFREDLYHRLAVVTLRLPPLRDRDEDIVRLGEHFLSRACEDYGLAPKTLSADARAALLTYPWPGNVRELANVMERVALLSDGETVTAAALALPSSRPRLGSAASEAEDRRTVLEAERSRVVEALRATKWNISRAAARLGLPRNTLRYRMEKHGLNAQASAVPRPAVPADTATRIAARGPVVTAGIVHGPAPAGLRWEPRRVTLLRTRLVSVSADPASSEVSRAMEVVFDKVHSFGGQIHELSPTSILAAFGLEPVIEDAPRRAAHAAMAVDRAVARARQENPAGPRVRLAIHTVQLLVGRLDGEARMDADAQGAAKALLDALLDRADPGILLSASSAAFLRRWYRLATHAATEGDRAVVYRLGAPLEPDRGLTPFVGREGELGLLVERLERASDGEGQTVVVIGEPGIGKSRLLQELRRRATGTATWLEGHAVSFGGTMPFHPVINLLRRAFRIQDGDPEATVLGKIDEHVLRWGEELRPVLPFLRALLGVDPGDPSVADLEPDMRRARIIDATRRLFLRAAELRPLVMLYEDVHWMDQATEDYLTEMADSIATGRILLVLTARPGYTPPFADRSDHTRLALRPLSTAESLELACALLAVDELPGELQALIIGRVEGNPFFLEETIRSLHETGALRRRGGRVIVDRHLDELAMPDTIEDVLLARVARLDETPRRLLQVASVIGKDVAFVILRAIADLPEERLRHELARLQAAEFLSEVRPFPELEYSFKHALTRDVAYGGVEPTWRRALHARIVEAIERIHQARLEEHVERLAHHAYRGELWEKAVTYARQAGRQVLARSANREAAACFENALRAVSALPESQERRALAVDLRLDLRTALSPLGEYERILEQLREAQALAESLNDQGRLARISTDMMHFSWATGHHDEAIAWGQRALAFAAALGDVTLEALAHYRLSRVHHALADYRQAIDCSVRGFVVLEKARSEAPPGQAPAGVPSRHWLVWSLAELGELREGVAVAQEASALAEADGRPLARIGAGLGLGYLRLVKGDLADATAALEPALALIGAWQFPAWFPPVAAALASAYALSGRVLEALPLLEEAVARGSSMRLLVGQAYWIALLGEASARAGRIDAAMTLLDRALTLSRERRERGGETWARRFVGEVALLREPPNADQAAIAFRESAALAEELGMRPVKAHCHFGLGRVCQLTGNREQAEAHLATAIDMYGEMNMDFWRTQAESLLKTVAR